MIERSLLLVGGGRMGRALAQGMIRGGALAADSLTVADHNAESRRWWAQNVPQATVVPSAAEAVAGSPAASEDQIVILAVKPNRIEALVQRVRQSDPAAWQQSLVISVAAGVSLATLTRLLGSERIARVMPNTPSLVGAGASAYCCGQAVREADEADLRTILAAVGEVIAVPEYQMDAVTGVSGSGPAYVFLFIEALADGGVLAGLPRAAAMQLATQTVLGAAKMVAETREHPGQLKDAVASPGGTTIAALRTLEHNGFRAAVIDAVKASADRSRELSGE